MEKNSPTYINVLLDNNIKAVERAIVVLYNRQTVDEQSESNTKHSNGRGFSAFDAGRGTYIAKYILAGNHLSGKWVEEARKIAKKHIKQLIEEATYKMNIRKVT